MGGSLSDGRAVSSFGGLTRHAAPPASLIASLSREVALICDVRGSIVWADERARSWLRACPGDAFSGLTLSGSEEKARRLASEACSGNVRDVEVVLATGDRREPVTFVFRGAPYEGDALLVGSAAPEDFGAPMQQMGVMLAELAGLQRQSQSQQRALRNSEQRTRTLAEANAAARHRSDLLAEASLILGASLDCDEALREVARLVVPAFAEACAIDLRRDDEWVRLVVTPAGARIPAGVGGVGGERTRAEVVVEAADRVVLAAPIVVRKQEIGCIILERADPPRPFLADDLIVAEELARRAASAIDNASLYAESRAAQARYHAIFEGVADAIVVADEHGVPREANPAAHTLLGVPDIAGMERYASSGRWVGEVEWRRPDGSAVPVESSVTPVELPNGTMHVSIARDITERRKLERMQREFMVMVTHRLRAVNAPPWRLQRTGCRGDPGASDAVEPAGRRSA